MITGIIGQVVERFSFAFFLLSRLLSEAPGAVTRRAEAQRRSLGAERTDLTALGAERHSVKEEEPILRSERSELLRLRRAKKAN